MNSFYARGISFQPRWNAGSDFPALTTLEQRHRRLRHNTIRIVIDSEKPLDSIKDERVCKRCENDIVTPDITSRLAVYSAHCTI